MVSVAEELAQIKRKDKSAWVDEHKQQYDKDYDTMRGKMCPYFKEPCLGESCIAFAGHCDIQGESYSIVSPHCQMFQETGLLYELAELAGNSQSTVSEEPRWAALDSCTYRSREAQNAIDKIRKANGLPEECDL